MKTVKKTIDVLVEGMETNVSALCGGYDQGTKISLSTREYLHNIDITTLELVHSVQQPETLREFLDLHQLKKSELLDWVNENYKK